MKFSKGLLSAGLRAARWSALALSLAVCGQAPATAADFPAKPVTIVVPFSAGGFTDLLTRQLGNELGEKWGVPVVVENRVGAGGNIGAAYVARAKPDGYTLLVANTASNAINQYLYDSIGFDAEKDFVSIALLAKTPNVVVVHPGSGWKSVADMVAAARARAEGLNYGSAGNGTTSHLTGALFAKAVGVSLEHVPFKGSSEVMTALQAQTVQLAFDNIVAWAPLITSGRVRALAVTGSKRSSLLPDAPTLAEAGYPGVESYSWFGLVAPANTPQAIVERINRDANDIIARPAFAQKLAGAEITAESPQAFDRFMADERAKWRALIQEMGLKPRGAK